METFLGPGLGQRAESNLSRWERCPAFDLVQCRAWTQVAVVFCMGRGGTRFAMVRIGHRAGAV